MKDFHHKERSLWKGRHFIGLLFVLAGMFALASPYIFQLAVSTFRVLAVGTTTILFGLILISTYEGFIISFAQNRIRHYESFGGFRVGQWEELPTILYVRLSNSTYTATNVPNGISPTLSGKVTDYIVNLVNVDEQTYLSIVFDNEMEALSSAKALSKGFSVELKI